MLIQKAQTKEQEPSIPLKNTKPGDCIRFAHDTFEEALKSDLFFIRVDAPEAAKDQVKLINLKDGKQLQRDGDHRVIVHDCFLSIEN